MSKKIVNDPEKQGEVDALIHQGKFGEAIKKQTESLRAKVSKPAKKPLPKKP